MESTIGRYRLLKRLATGGMGEVYLASQSGAQGFQKFVALKRVAASAAADPELISLFLDEARLVATLSHRSIVQVYDLGQDEAGFFVAMEFVQGPSVRALLDRLQSQGQRLPAGIALDVAAQVGDALACAYYSRAPDGTPLRIIHRDVSPRNILVSVSGDVKLIDFGIAQSMRQIGSAGGLTGKLAYMSPEQLRSEPLNARSDLFSLGIVLCEMLGGENPFFRADPKEMVQAIQRDPPKLPSATDPALSPCDAVLRRLLAKLPSERFADGIELAEALAEVRTHFPKPPKRLSAIVSDLFGLEINELMRGAAQGTRAEPTPARPPPGLATPPRREAPKEQDAGLGTDAAPASPNSPSIYHRVTQPYLSVARELEVTQPLSVPKILRSQPAAPGAEPLTSPQPIPASEPLEVDTGDVQPIDPPSSAVTQPVPAAPPPVAPEPHAEPAKPKAEEPPAAAPAATLPGEVPAMAAPVLAPDALPAGAVPAEPPPGAPKADLSWYKISIPHGKAPPAGALPTSRPEGKPFDEGAWFLVSVPPVKKKAADAPVAKTPEEVASDAQTTLPSTPDALVRARSVSLMQAPPPVSTETTIPGAKPLRSRANTARNVGLAALAIVSVVIGVGVGLYIVRGHPVPPPLPRPAAPPQVAAPEPSPTPAPPPVAPSPEPEAPPQPPLEPPRTVVDIKPADMLAPLAPANPAPAMLRPDPDKARLTRLREDVKPAVKPAEVAKPPEPPKPEEASPFQLIADGPLGTIIRPMAGSGSVLLGESEGMSITLTWVAGPEALKTTLECQPWAIAAINGLSQGKTPIPLDLKELPVKVELRRPGAQPVLLQLAARKPH